MSYTEEQKQNALKVFFDIRDYSKAINALGYPSLQTLRTWVKKELLSTTPKCSEIVNLYIAGNSIKDISDTVGIDCMTVSTFIEECGIRRRYGKEAKKNAMKLMCEDKYSYNHVMGVTNISISTLYRWMYKAGKYKPYPSRGKCKVEVDSGVYRGEQKRILRGVFKYRISSFNYRKVKVSK